MKGLHEILTTKEWMIDPMVASVFRHNLEQNLNGHLLLDQSRLLLAKKMRRDKDGVYHASQMAYEDDEVWTNSQDATEEDDNYYVCCIWVDGPVTRNGGACSYGSRDHRDIILECIQEDECIGVLFYLNTPGGSSAAISDYKYAINKVREKGLPVLAFVDGMAASAGMYIAALCDERYYMNPKDEVGSIGTYAAWYTLKDGEKYNDETYHEVYDPESYDKNKWYRDSMEQDYKLIVAELKKHGAEFRADVKAACPKATDDHLHGKMFPCSEVTGILMDGQKDFDECLQRIDEIYQTAKHSPISDGSASASEGAFYHAHNLTVINIENMDKKYVTIASLCGVEELHTSDEGVFLNAPLVENMNANLKQSREAYESKIALTEKESQKKLDDQKATYDAQLKELQDKLDASSKTIEELQTKLDEQAKAIEGHAAALKAKDDTIAEHEQTISDLQAQVKDLTNGPGDEPEAGASPANNGAGVHDEGFTCEVPQWEDSLTPQANYDRMKEYEANLKEKICKV